MPEKASIFFDRSPVLTTLDGFKGSVLAQYQKEGSPLQSGYLIGEQVMNGYAAAIDVEHGEGHVILFGFRPQFRARPFGTFKMLFNAAFYAGGVTVAEPLQGFWTAPPPRPDPAPTRRRRRR